MTNEPAWLPTAVPNTGMHQTANSSAFKSERARRARLILCLFQLFASEQGFIRFFLPINDLRALFIGFAFKSISPAFELEATHFVLRHELKSFEFMAKVD